MNLITRHACMDSLTYAPTRHFVRPNTAATEFIVAAEPAFDFASTEYRALHWRSRATAFQGAHWLDALHHDVAPAVGAEPTTIAVRDATDGRLVLVLPLARHRVRGVTFLTFADFGLCDYLGPVYDPADAALLLADTRLPQRVAAALPRHDVLSVDKLAPGDVLLEQLFPRAYRARMRVSAYPVKIKSDWESWRTATLDISFRRDLDMKRRRIVRRGAPAFVLLDDPQEIARAFDSLRAFRATRFKERGAHDVIDGEAVFSFYRRIAVEGAQDGTARTFCLYLSGEPAAVMFGVADRGTFSLILVGFDLARYRRLSIGLLAIEDTLRASFVAGDSVYDFTIGDYSYKTQFGGQPTALYEWHQAHTLRGHAAVLAITLLREAKRTLKPLVKRAKERLTKSAPAVA
jgi:CelD/BcsL family acetyltransferase involved in cellulose biosynthesis